MPSKTDEIFKQMATAMSPFIEGNTAPLDEARVLELIRDNSTVITVTDNTRKVSNTVNGHVSLKQVLSTYAAGFNNLLMVGEAGTGKTTIAADMAKALSLDFAFISCSAGVTEPAFLGRVLPQSDGSWKHQSTEFLRIYENGGVFLLDEIDNADANVMVILNAALANGKLINPITGVVHKRHKDCVLIAAANTYGHGADAKYVGRNQLDAATLDRFVGATIEVTYDTTLEKNLLKGILGTSDDVQAIISTTSNIRKAISRNNARRIFSTRSVLAMANHVKAGLSMAKALDRVTVGWSDNDKRLTK